MQKCLTTVHTCHCAQLSYTTQHRAVLIILSLETHRTCCYTQPPTIGVHLGVTVRHFRKLTGMGKYLEICREEV